MAFSLPVASVGMTRACSSVSTTSNIGAPSDAFVYKIMVLPHHLSETFGVTAVFSFTPPSF